MSEIRVVGAGGEYMESVVVVEWHKAVGDRVSRGDPLVTVETVKAATEIAAETDGILSDILAPVGTEVEVGALLGRIGGPGAGTPAVTAPAPTPPADVAPEVPAASQPVARGDRVVASPLARRLARRHGIDLGDLPAPEGPRLKSRDVEAYRAVQGGAADRRPAGGLHVRRREGTGIPIVFIHGFGGDGTTWRPLLSALTLPNPTLLVDLPSHGRSPAGRAGGIRDLAAEVAAAIGEGPVHLVGHSLGGAVAIALAEHADVDVRSLTLIAPAGLGPEIDGAFLDGFTRASRNESLAPWMKRLVADASLITPSLVEATIATRARPGLGEEQRRLSEALFPDGTQATDLRAVLARQSAPQRIVWGMSDAILPWRQALGLPGRAALHLLPGIGHLPQMEAVGIVAGILEEAIRGHG